MKFLHMGDLHLDSPFCTMGAESAENRRERQRKILERIFITAKSEGCDMILASGDVFDGSYVSEKTASIFCGLVRDFSLPVVVAPGNHDPYTKNSFYAKNDLPDNLYVFSSSSEMQMFAFPELETYVWGYAFTSPSLEVSPLMTEAQINESEGIHILCAHGDLGAPVSRYSPINLADIDRWGFSYAALGHIHKRGEVLTEEGTPVVYCGFPEGRGFDEEGDGGVYIVDANDFKTEYRWLGLSEKCYVSAELDIEGVADTEELVDKARAAISEYGSATHMRLILKGAAALELLYDMRTVESRLKGELEYFELINETVETLSSEQLEKDITLRGELYRTLLPLLESPSPEERRKAKKALNIGLAAIDGRSVFGGR